MRGGGFCNLGFVVKDTHSEKHRQMKHQCLQKVKISAFGMLVQQINSL